MHFVLVETCVVVHGNCVVGISLEILCYYSVVVLSPCHAFCHWACSEYHWRECDCSTQLRQWKYIFIHKHEYIRLVGLEIACVKTRKAGREH